MTLYQFNMLDKIEQAEAVWDGVHIGERLDGEFEILLYHIDSFYVEVYYNREYNTISKLRSFSSIDQLYPYVRKIDISKL